MPKFRGGQGPPFPLPTPWRQLHFCTNKITGVLWAVTRAAVKLSLSRFNDLSCIIPHKIKRRTEAFTNMSRSFETCKMLKII